MPLNKHLKINSKGDAVAELHDALRILAPKMPAAEPLSPHLETVFAREVSAKRFGKATKSILTKIQRSNGLPETGEADDPTRAFLERMLGAVDDGGVPRPAPPSKAKNEAAAKVSGMIMDAAGRPLAGVEVTLEALTAGAASQLSQGFTDKEGAYALHFDAGARGTAPAVRIAVRTASGEEVRSSALFDPPPKVDGLNVVVSVKAAGHDARTDFERDCARLKKAAADASLDLLALTETADDPQASLLAAESGIPAERVALVVAALRLFRDSAGSVSAELAYALGASGVSFGAVALARLPKDALKRAVEGAIAAGHASRSALDGLDVSVEAARDFLRRRSALAIEGTELGRILRAAFKEANTETAKKTKHFLELAARHDGDHERFWDAVKTDGEFGDEDRDELAFRLPAAAMTGANAKAVDMLVALRKSERWSSVKDLCSWDADTWMAQLENFRVPVPFSDAASEKERERNLERYARGIDRFVEAMYPDDYLRDKISKSTLRHEAEIGTFLKKIGECAFHRCDLDAVLKKERAAAEKLNVDATEQLRALHRVIRVTGRASPAIRLVEDGLLSARRISVQGRRSFARKYSNVFGGVEPALKAHAAASSTAFAAAELWWQSLSDFVDQGIAVLPGEGAAVTVAADSSGDTAGDTPTLPNWPSLFGAEDACACAHCRSATSPGAYLVDVMEFLKERAAAAGNSHASALDVLLDGGRRPDLAELELTCENAETIVPYVDLVNEALEDAIAPLPPFPSPQRTLDSVSRLTMPDSDRIDPEFRERLNEALDLTGDNAKEFAIGADARVVSLTEGRPWQAAPLRWRIEDRLASYNISQLGDSDTDEVEIESRCRSTIGPSSERLLQAQYENAAAYGRLARAFYPWTLPFDRTREEARVGLAAIKRQFADILEDFASGTPIERRRRQDVAVERLGLSPVDALLVTWEKDAKRAPGFDTDEPWQVWGLARKRFMLPERIVFSTPDPEDPEKKVSCDDEWHKLLGSRLDVLMDRAQLSTGQVLALLDTDYVNPPARGEDDEVAEARTIAIVSRVGEDPATCRTRDLSLEGFAEEPAIRMARMVRLSMRCGLSFREIDQAISALGGSDIEPAFLVHLAKLRTLRSRLNIAWDSLCAMFISIGPWSSPLRRPPPGVTETRVKNASDGALKLDLGGGLLTATRFLGPSTREALLGMSTQPEWTAALKRIFAQQGPLKRYWMPTRAARHVDHSEDETRLAPTFYEKLLRPGRSATTSWVPADPQGLDDLNLADGATELAAAFGIHASDITDLLGSKLVIPGGEDDGESERGASLCSVAKLQRHAEVMRGLELRSRDYLQALELWEGDPFSEPATLADFVADIDRVTRSPFAISELMQLCRGEREAPSDAIEAADTTLLATLREALGTIAAENVFVPREAAKSSPTTDPDGVTLATKLVAIGMPRVLTEAVVEALSDTKARTVQMDPPRDRLDLDGPIELALEESLSALPKVPDPENPGESVDIDIGSYVDDPGDVDHPAVLEYDSEKKALRTNRKLRPHERQSLIAATSDEAWRTAIDALVKRQHQPGTATYDAKKRTLTFTGYMSADWREYLISMDSFESSTARTWRDGIDEVYAAPREVVRQVLKAWKLSEQAETIKGGLPLKDGAPIELPESLTGRLVLDFSGPGDPELRLNGPLLDEERGKLIALATPTEEPLDTAEPFGFRNAVNELFRKSNDTEPNQSDQLLGLQTIEQLDALLDCARGQAQRYEILLRELLPTISGILSRDVLIAHLASALNLPEATADWLAARRPSDGEGEHSVADRLVAAEFIGSDPTVAPNRQAFASQHEAVRWLRQAALLAKRLDMTKADFELLDGLTERDWPSLDKLPLERVPRDDQSSFSMAEAITIAEYARIRDLVPGGRLTLAAIIRGVEAEEDELRELAAKRHRLTEEQINDLVSTNRLGRALLIKDASSIFGVPESEIELLISSKLLNFPHDPEDFRTALLSTSEDCRNGPGLFRLVDAIRSLVGTGLGATTVAKLREIPLDRNSGRTVIAAIARGMDPVQWREQGKALRDNIRMRSRGALTAYLLAYGSTNADGSHTQWRTPAELSGHLLIDVEMGACMETSRLKQAMSSVQFFVQRCRLGLEHDVSADPEEDDAWAQWDWMRTHRVWEANKKGFLLFPENLLKPEFMDLKSPQYRELEGALGQGEVTMESASRAVVGYLHSLKDVANLEPVTIIEAMESDGRKIIHVLGASRGEPRKLFYRRREDTGVWSAWEPVDLEIKSRHVLLHVFCGGLFVFWLEVSRASENSGKDENIALSEQLYVRLGWSKLTENGWSEQKVSAEKIPIDVTDSDVQPEDLILRARVADGSLQLNVAQRDYGSSEYAYIDQYFCLSYPGAEPEKRKNTQLYGPDSLGNLTIKVSRPALPPMNKWRYSGSGQARRVDPDEQATPWRLNLPGRHGHLKPVLTNILGSANLIHSSYDVPFDEFPFILYDSRRSFLVSSRIGLWLPASAFAHPSTVDAVRRGMVLSSIASRSQAEDEAGVPNALLGQSSIDPLQLLRSRVDGGESSLLGRSLPLEPTSVKAVADRFRAIRLAPESSERRAQHAVSRRRTEGRGSVFAAMGLDLSFAQPDLEVRPLDLASASAQKVQLGGDMVAMEMLSPNAGLGVLGWNSQPDATLQWVEQEVRRYSFGAFYHPYADMLIEHVGRRGVFGMLDREVQLRPHAPVEGEDRQAVDFASTYGSTSSYVEKWSPAKETLDFEHGAAYAIYNWELFFHIPMLIADRLASSERHAEALKWLNAVFDPTDRTRELLVPDEQGDERSRSLGSARAWQTKPLFLNSLPPADGGPTKVARERIERLLRLFAEDAAHQSGSELAPEPLETGELADVESFRDQVEEVRRNPFRPYAVARLRTTSFQRAVVMKYVEILLRWGDRLFRRDTMETINEASQLYMMAASFRGRQAASMPPRAVSAPQTYKTLAERLDGNGNALIAIEGFITPHASAGSTAPAGDDAPPPPSMLAFCVPRNEKLDRLWSDVADRLWKIRNCRNIDGVERKLALFEPPIDPELLARAKAAGLDVAAAVAFADTGGPPPRHKFRFLANQAADLAAEVRGLGQALLSALEKRDAEQLAVLRAEQETAMLERALDVRQLQIDEAKASLEALRASWSTAFTRLNHYRRLLGEDDADAAALQDLTGDDGAPFIAPRADTATHSSRMFRMFAAVGGALGGPDLRPGEGLAGLPVNDYEEFELALGLHGQFLSLTAQGIGFGASFAEALPDQITAPMGVGAITTGGSKIGGALSRTAEAIRTGSDLMRYAASVAGKAGQLAVRADEWILQHNLAVREIIAINRQILASQIRVQIVEKEKANQDAQIDEAKEIEQLIKKKDTNFDHYGWMAGRLSELHSSMYDLAFDWARRAERAAKEELYRKDLSYIKYNQSDDRRKRLLVGETLAADIKRLRMAYEELDEREEEMIKHVSLARIDPSALIRFRETGAATFRIPEAAFDLDVPGQYLRRIRSVAVTIPCVSGPYTGVHCRLTLLRSSIRTSTRDGKAGAYVRTRDEDDSRFMDHLGQVQGIVTSSAREDPGLFQPQDPADQRRLPFEGAGAISEWRVELPQAMRAFDYSTISDIVLHVRYTARNGGDEFRAKVEGELADALNRVQSAFGEEGLLRSFSLRYEAPSAWHRFVCPPSGAKHEMDLPIALNRLPYFVGSRPVTVQGIEVLLRVSEGKTASFYKRNAIFGRLRTPGGTSDGVELMFEPWLKPVMRAYWPHSQTDAQRPQGDILISEENAVGSTNWRLTLGANSSLEAPLDEGAIDDVEIVLRYSI